MMAAAALIAMVGCTVMANLLMTLGSAEPPSPYLLGILSLRTVSGLAVFGLGGLFYTVVLRFLPLNVAQSYAAAQFISVIIASQLILGEVVPPARWAGITMIAIGIAVVAWYDT